MQCSREKATKTEEIPRKMARAMQGEYHSQQHMVEDLDASTMADDNNSQDSGQGYLLEEGWG